MAEGINTHGTCQKRVKSVEVWWAKRMQELRPGGRLMDQISIKTTNTKCRLF
jgi:hypothetical protein